MPLSLYWCMIKALNGLQYVNFAWRFLKLGGVFLGEPALGNAQFILKVKLK